MKTLFAFLLALVLFTGLASATIITVSNNPNNPAQYYWLQDAINAATDGDTIYVQESLVSHGSIDLTKRLVLIGSGPGPSGFGSNTLKSEVLQFKLFRDSGSKNPSGSVIMGFQIGIIGVENGSLSVTDITIQANQVSNIIPNTTSGVNNWIIKNNIITNQIYPNQGAQNCYNILITNNIITGNSSVYHTIFNFASVQIDHNTFIFSSPSGFNPNFNNNGFLRLSGAIVTNNIFYWERFNDKFNVITQSNNCTFNNNLSSLSAIGDPLYLQPSDDFVGSYIQSPFGGNSGGGNNIGVIPEFVSATNYSFEVTDDYHLKPGSPGKNAATDGTDLGIYGGASAWPETIGPPSIPLAPIPWLISVDLLNSTVPKDGTLKVNVKAKSQN